MKRRHLGEKGAGGDEERPLAIVGIGASAGGLEAIEAFFQAVPLDSGMAFVVVQHLSPDHKSLMVELLSRRTELPVTHCEDEMTVRPNHIYLIPPKTTLTLFHGKLLLAEQTVRGPVNLPVDIFLRSLAADQGDRAVAVILSGTGSDGTRGVRAVKEAGGVVLVQSSESAKFDGMPRAAASSGLADFILTPAEMADQLMACLHHPFARQKHALQEHETGLTRLFSLLRAKTKVDFTFYKMSTIMRRIERRIAVTQTEDLDDYVRFAEESPTEVSVLYRELLIGVTNFFRDPEVMELLQQRYLPELLENRDQQELRFWVAGCSTGEEAYTLAILVREVMETIGVVKDVKIFATDIDRDAIIKAGTGRYSESITADLDATLLAKYFYPCDGTYQVARTIREMVVFAQHNLVKDPPFTRIDLVSCRNLLIYLQTNLQQHALEMFSFSLNDDGVLVLGTSESVGEMDGTFRALNRKARIYRATGVRQARNLTPHALRPTPHRELRQGPGGQYADGRLSSRDHERLLTRLLEALSAIYAQLAVVVDQHQEILHIVGDSRGIITLPAGRAVFDISKMVERELSIPLTTGIQKVFRTGEDLVYSNVRLQEHGESQRLSLRLQLLPGRRNDEPLCLVVFERLDGQDPLDAEMVEYDLGADASQRLQDLEQELMFTRENLQATIEELETSNEELQATNEELLASNEELQSTNEELQSTNEELHTVNAEYQNKIMELTEVQNDIDNLLSSSRIGTLILDENLCIRRFSPQAARLFNMVGSDIGRPLKHLSHMLLAWDPLSVARQVQDREISAEVEVEAEDGTTHLVRVIPYRIGPRDFAGVVMTLVDVSDLRRMNHLLQQARGTEAEIVHHIQNGLLVLEVTEDDQFILRSLNESAESLTGLVAEQACGKPLGDIWPGAAGEQLAEQCLRSHRSGKMMHMDALPFAPPSGDVMTLHLHIFKLPGDRLGISFELAEMTTEEENAS